MKFGPVAVTGMLVSGPTVRFNWLLSPTYVPSARYAASPAVVPPNTGRLR